MVGNDIVDLNEALKESNWKRKGYLEKIFTEDERFLIGAAKDQEQLVWLLWSMKESVYKIYASKTKIRTFAPTLISCNNLIIHKKTATGQVAYEGEHYFTRSTIDKKYIHTIAAHEIKLLEDLIVKISTYDPSNSTYRATNPNCVSHHGDYLALIY